MKTVKRISYLVGFISLFVIYESCLPDPVADPNPFEENIKNQDTVNFVFNDIDPNTIVGLYQNIFGPTCANSGCHDGTFEPDFRTIESSYHSLVYRIPVKNDGSLTYRVDPGNPNKSAIVKRLAGTISPQMPIEIEPDSDWWTKSEEYIQNVTNWIANGALDMAGNEPQINYANPTLIGAAAQFNGVWLNRKDGYGPLMIPDSVNNIDIYLSFDPINNPDAFGVNELMFGFEGESFEMDTSITMEIMNNPVAHYSLYGKLVSYTHKVTIDLDNMALTEDHYFMRVKVQDGSHPITEIPSENGFYYFKEYMSFIRTD
jgi:hypothetical protein